MERPRVENVLNDRERKVRYVFVAYRTMTRTEKVEAYRVWHSSNRTPRTGSTVVIETSYGIND